MTICQNNCSNPSHLTAHQAGSVERREAYVCLHLSITANIHNHAPCLISKSIYRDDISYMYPKLPPVHPKRMLLADLERKGSEFEKKDILNQRKQYLWIRSIHAFKCEYEIHLCLDGRESILFVVSAHGGSYL